MRSAARAIAWEFQRRHRWGLLVLIGYMTLLAAIKLLVLQWQRVNLESAETFALVVVVPVTATFMYFLGVFTFGLAGDLAARQSMYPARMFTLPVTTAELAGWPMLYGTIAMAMLWLGTRLFAAWPTGFDIPIIWPGLLAASLLAWTQALTWMPYGLPGMRVVITVLWLVLIDTVVMLALEYKASETVMLAILAPHVPLAYFAAYFAITRARRGDVPDWRGTFERLGKISNVFSFRQDHFASASGAQTWFEWRRNGVSLPASVGILLPFELALLFVFRETPSIVIEIILAVLLTPPVMAAFAAATVSKSSSIGSDAHHLAPFIATRPLTSALLIAAKLKATIRSTLASWLLVLIAIPIAVKLSGTSHVLGEQADHLIKAVGTARAVAILLLGISTLFVATWKQLVKSLYIGMSGREWVVKASVFVTLSLLAISLPLGHWIVRSRIIMATLWNGLPWIAAVGVFLKISAVAWIAMRLRESRLLSDRTIVIGAICWTLLVFALYGLLAWIIPGIIMRRYFLALVAILAIPLARLSAAPLALASNRHRGRKTGSVITHSRKRIMAAVLILISLPMAVALEEAVSFRIWNQNNGFMISSGEKREYLLYVPKSYDHTKPTPLVISMHGAGGWPTQQMEMSGWNGLAEKQKFIVVYPSGSDRNGPRTWSVEEGESLPRDVRFISELIDHLETTYNIDPARIYANGLSNGGGMSFVLSCTLSDRIAAVGMVAAAQTMPFRWCADHRPVPMISFHGTADSMTPYNGGSTWVAPGSFPNISAWTSNWARRNGCDRIPIESPVADGVSLREYKNCVDDAAVELYILHGGGHTWPGGKPLPEWFAGSTSNSIDATNRMWTFFLQHPLQRK